MACSCIIAWVPDESVKGTHNVQPVTCASYTAALEAAVMSGTADSLTLESIQRAHGVLPSVVRSPLDGTPVGIKTPALNDSVRTWESWREEIMAQMLTSGEARIDTGQMVLSVDFGVDEGDDRLYAWTPPWGVHDFRKMQEHLRENGIAAWNRPQEGVELVDGVYRAKKPIDHTPANIEHVTAASCPVVGCHINFDHTHNHSEFPCCKGKS